MTARAGSQGNSQYLVRYDFHSGTYSLLDRQIRFQVDRIKKTIAISIYRIPRDVLINNLDPSRVKLEQRATNDFRRPAVNFTTLGEMPFLSAEALLRSLQPRQIYPINISPNGTVNSFTINY